MLLCIILPISWENIISRKLFNDDIVSLNRIVTDRWTQAQKVASGFETGNVVYVYNMGSSLNRARILGFESTHETHIRLQRYFYEYYTPAIIDIESAVDDVQRKRINIENTKNMVFFFNPIVLFRDISNRIAGNSRVDYLRFLHDGRIIRNELTSIGAREGWLFDYGYFAEFADERLMGDEAAFWERFAVVGMETLYQELMLLMETAEKFSFEMPSIRRYEQPNPTFTEIFSRIATVLAMFVVSILALWVLTWVRFMRYDVR
jgi:hypothetical protein